MYRSRRDAARRSANRGQRDTTYRSSDRRNVGPLIAAKGRLDLRPSSREQISTIYLNKILLRLVGNHAPVPIIELEYERIRLMFAGRVERFESELVT